MQGSLFVAVGRNLAHAVTDERTLSAFELLDLRDVSAGHVIAHLRHHVRVLFHIIRHHHRRESLAARVVEFLPRVFATQDQVANQHAGDRSVCDPVPGIAGRNVDVLVVRIAADVRHRVDRLHHLT